MSRQPGRHSDDWGGSREGAGRPAGEAKRTVSLSLSDKLVKRLDREADKRRASRSELVELLLGEWFANKR